MSRGPGRLQRAILFVLDHDNPEPFHRRRQVPLLEDQVAADEWTTEDVCSALSGPPTPTLTSLFGVRPTDTIKQALLDDLGESGWWWEETFTRQVRRALDRLHATGRVEKRLLPNRRYEAKRRYFDSQERYDAYVARHPQPTVAMWRLRAR